MKKQLLFSLMIILALITNVKGQWSLLGNYGTNPVLNFIGTVDVQDLVFRTNSLEKMRILSNGNIGIATSSPSALLHLRNPYSFYAGDSYTFMKFENRHYSNLETLITIGASTYQPYISLFVAGSTTVRTTIGSTNSNFNGTVKVDGILTAKEIQVKTNVYGDYVFNSDYDLMPLSKLELYIKANNHLPEIPTESEALKNGINVGEMNVLLLKKVEELTLYVIQLKKENEEIRNLIGK